MLSERASWARSSAISVEPNSWGGIFAVVSTASRASSSCSSLGSADSSDFPYKYPIPLSAFVTVFIFWRRWGLLIAVNIAMTTRETLAIGPMTAPAIHALLFEYELSSTVLPENESVGAIVTDGLVVGIVEFPTAVVVVAPSPPYLLITDMAETKAVYSPGKALDTPPPAAGYFPRRFY